MRVAKVGLIKDYYVSAASALIHELGHAYQFSIGGLRGVLPEMPVINGVEKTWAVFNKEAVRFGHGGATRTTDDIFARTIYRGRRSRR